MDAVQKSGKRLLRTEKIDVKVIKKAKDKPGYIEKTVRGEKDIYEDGIRKVIIIKDDEGELVREYSEVYVLHTLDESSYHISEKERDTIAKLIKETDVKFIEIGDTLLAVHQITKIDKKAYPDFRERMVL